MPNAAHISDLLLRKLSGTLDAHQATELQEWLVASRDHQLLLEELTDQELLADDLVHLSEDSLAVNKEIIFDKVMQGIAPPQNLARMHVLKTAWFRYAAAIVVLLGIGAYLWNSQHHPDDLLSQNQPAPVEKEILPGSNKAILTLGDGQQVQLDNTANPVLAKNGISHTNSLLEYNDKAATTAINTLATPRGGQYQVKLSDGTMVWLNAASSISYPMTFDGQTREVKVTGEVYFEVAKNKTRPFIVKTPKDDITVLGTSFNVNCYTDEPAAKISLIEGALKVGQQLLQPGQAYVNGKIVNTNAEQDMAWKNGVFYFTDASLPVVLRQISRWYDVDVRYEGSGTGKKLRGKLSRTLPLSEMIRGLQDLHVNVRLDRKTIIVQ